MKWRAGVFSRRISAVSPGFATQIYFAKVVSADGGCGIFLGRISVPGIRRFQIRNFFREGVKGATLFLQLLLQKRILLLQQPDLFFQIRRGRAHRRCAHNQQQRGDGTRPKRNEITAIHDASNSNRCA